MDREIFDIYGIITALCDVHNRCSVCYRYSKGGSCTNCNEVYYGDCHCKPLTREEIENYEG